ncbi:MAG: hypothetical protein GY759_00390 [Chloroflexi bacterium]|nr:hypothetical protein [Chloroflexota bacterium]
MAVTKNFDASALFEAYITRMADCALEQIQAAGNALPAETDRELVLNSLNYLFDLPSA